MRFIKIDSCDLNNGIGARVVLWVGGCDLHCNGCHNKEFWDFELGQEFTDETTAKLLDLLSNDFISGLSILGGEPLHNKNKADVFDICNVVKQTFPNKDIWLWTGYCMEDLGSELPNVDIIIDGKYDKDKPTYKKWRGSDNQRMWGRNHDGGWTLIL